jgi:predicted dehydrogenase
VRASEAARAAGNRDFAVGLSAEKPPAESATEAVAVARVAKATGTLCTTAFKKRYNRAYTRAKEWLGKYPPENLLSLSIDYCSGPYENNTPLDTFLLDFGIHVIDLAQFLSSVMWHRFALSPEISVRTRFRFVSPTTRSVRSTSTMAAPGTSRLRKFKSRSKAATS